MSNPIFNIENPTEGMEIVSPNNGIRYIFENGAWRVANVNAKDIVRMDDVSDTAIEGLVEDDKWFWWDEDKLELKIWQNNAWLPVNFQEHNADVVVQDYDDTEIRTLIDNNTNAISDEETRATDSEADLQAQIDALGLGDGKVYLESLESVLAAGRAEKIRVVTPTEWDALADKPLNTLFIVLDTTAGRGRWYLGTYPLFADIVIELPEPPPSPIKLAFSVTVGEWEGPMDSDKIEAVFVVENISEKDACELSITYPDGTVIDVGTLEKGGKHVFSRSTTDESVYSIAGTYTADGVHPHVDGVDDKEQVVVVVPDKPERPDVAILTSVTVDEWIDNTDPEFVLANPDAFQTTIYFNLENQSEEDDVSVQEKGNSGLVWEATTARALDGIVLAGEKRSVKATFSSDDLDPDNPLVISGTATAKGSGFPETIDFEETVKFPLLPGESIDVPTTEDPTRHVVVTDQSFDVTNINSSKGIAPIKTSNATDVKVIEHPTLGAGYYEVSWNGDMQNELGSGGKLTALVHVVNIGTSVAKGVDGLVDPDHRGYLFYGSKIGSLTEEDAIANDIVHESSSYRSSYLKGWFKECKSFNTKLNWTWDRSWWNSNSSYVSTNDMFRDCYVYNQPCDWMTAANGFPGEKWSSSSYMFQNCKEFNQDISNANALGNKGLGSAIDTGADKWEDFNPDGSPRCNRGRPQWGYDGATCVFDRDVNPEPYDEVEYTLLRADSAMTESSLKNHFPSLRYKTFSCEQQLEGWWLIKGVWDWNVRENARSLEQVSDILQFGYDPNKTAQPIINAFYAFNRMGKISEVTALEDQTVIFIGEPKYMFNGCSRFNQNLDKHTWNIFGNALNMFYGAKAFNNGFGKNESHVMGFAPIGPIHYGPKFGEAFNGELAGWDMSNIENVEDIFDYEYLYTQKITDWFTPRDGGIRWQAFGPSGNSDAKEFWENNNGFADWLSNPRWLPMDSEDNFNNYLDQVVGLGLKNGWINNADRPDFSDWTVYRPLSDNDSYFSNPNSFYDKWNITDPAVGPDKSGRPADSPEWGDPQYSVEPNWTTKTFDEAAWHIVLRTNKVFWPVAEYGEMDYDVVEDDGTEFFIPFDPSDTIIENHLKDVHSIASDPAFAGQSYFDFDVALDQLTSFNDIPNGFTIEPIVGGDYDGFYLLKAIFPWNSEYFYSNGQNIVDILQVGTSPFAHLGGMQDRNYSYVLPSKYEASERAFVSMNMAFAEMDFTEIMATGFSANNDHMWPMNGRYNRMFQYSNLDAKWFTEWKRPPLNVLSRVSFSQFVYGTPFNQDIRDWWLFQGIVIDNINSPITDELFSGAEKFNMGNAAGVLNVWDWEYAFQPLSFNRMFYDCKSLNIDISSWYVNEATNFDYMFKNCSMMNADLSKMNTCSMPYAKKPSSFDDGCNSWDSINKPIFGECRH
jgi:hypothetical protein